MMALERDKFEVIGGEDNFWLFSEAGGYDLTHPPKPDSPPIHPRLRLETTTKPAAIDPKKTALVCVDLQNYFLSPLLGRPTDAVGLKVVDNLLDTAIPACRKAGIPVLWLGWGLSREDIDSMPPTIVKGFAADSNFKGPRKKRGLGTDIGKLKLEDGTEIEGGRILMLEQWNS
jgi:hypothetical protein